MRKIAIYIIVFAIIFTFVFFGIKKGNVQKKPNVVIIITDDQGWGDVGFNGNEIIETPTLDSLAENGIIFNRFYVSPVCAPTRASLLTGKYHLSTGVSWVTHRKEVMHENETTIAEILKKNNYKTACIGKWHNGAQYPHNPLGQGFDYFFGFSAGHWNNYFDTKLEYQNELVQTKGYIADVFTDSVVSFISRTDDPFFTYVAYNTPHTPYQVPDSYFEKYLNKGLDDKTAAIYGMCENIDDNVQRIINALEKENKIDNTILVFVGDNGPNFIRYNGGFKGRKAQVDEGGIRVPFFISYPGGKLKARIVKDEFAAHIDLLPTLLDLCKIPAKQYSFDGVSFTKLLNNEKQQLQDRKFYTHQVLNVKGDYSSAIRTHDMLLAMYPNDTALYNLIDDPNQKTNIIALENELAQQLAQEYRIWLQNSWKNEIPEPIKIGYNSYPNISLPAHESMLEGKVEFAGGIGWSNDWTTHWTEKTDRISWDLKIVKTGEYMVQVLYGCNESDLNKPFIIKCQESEIQFEFDEIEKAPFVESPDKVKRSEVYERNWGVKNAGTIALNKGKAEFVLSFLENDISSIEIKGIELIEVSDI